MRRIYPNKDGRLLNAEDGKSVKMKLIMDEEALKQAIDRDVHVLHKQPRWKFNPDYYPTATCSLDFASRKTTNSPVQGQTTDHWSLVGSSL